MKKLFTLLVLSIGLLCSAVAQKVRPLSFNAGETLAATVATTDSTLTYIDSFVLKTNEAGVLETTVIGYASDTAYAVTGVKKVRYNKRRGTLTLGTVIDEQAVVTDAALGTSTFDIVAASNKIYVRVKGKAATNIRWYSWTRRKNLSYY